MKILFIHNTLVHYRVPFFLELSKKLDIHYFFTRSHLTEKIYGKESNLKDANLLDFEVLNNKFRIFHLIKFLINYKCDVVVIPSMDSIGEFIDSSLCFVISRFKGRKIIYFSEKWQPLDKPIPFKKRFINGLRAFVSGFFIRSCDVVVCSGSKASEYMTKVIKVKEEKIHIAYDASGIIHDSTDDLTANSNVFNELFPGNKRIILYLGRIIERKGLGVLIDAFKIISSKLDDVALVVAGDGDFKKICEERVKLEGVSNVFFLGAVPSDKTFELFSFCNVFVLPSLCFGGTIEAWGLTVNEAMACKKPVVATDAVGAAYDIIKNGYNGFMVAEGDSQELASKIIDALDNYDEYSKNAFETLQENFNYITMASQFADAINKVR